MVWSSCGDRVELVWRSFYADPYLTPNPTSTPTPHLLDPYLTPNPTPTPTPHLREVGEDELEVDHLDVAQGLDRAWLGLGLGLGLG